MFANTEERMVLKLHNLRFSDFSSRSRLHSDPAGVSLHISLVCLTVAVRQTSYPAGFIYFPPDSNGRPVTGPPC